MNEVISSKLLWSAVHIERAALADDLAGLTESRWALPSLCTRWTVEQVVAHLTAAASVGPLRWFASAIGARFDFGVHNDRRLAEHLGHSPAETLRLFRRIILSTTSPLGPTSAWLGEVIVHAEDIRRPLGIQRDVPIGAVTAVARFFSSRDFAVPSRSAVAGLRLEATDGPFAHGDGPLVNGSTLAITMVMAGRNSYGDQLTGPGAAVLRARFTSADDATR